MACICSLRCRCGFHDWTIVDEITFSDLYIDTYKKIHGVRPENISNISKKLYIKKVCKRCKKNVNEITKKRSEMIKAYEKGQIRKANRDLALLQITEELRYKNRNELEPAIKYENELKHCIACGSKKLKSKNGTKVFICKDCAQVHAPY